MVTEERGAAQRQIGRLAVEEHARLVRGRQDPCSRRQNHFACKVIAAASKKRLQLAKIIAQFVAPFAKISMASHAKSFRGREGVTANCQLPTANCQLPTANCQLPTANCQLPTAN